MSKFQEIFRRLREEVVRSDCELYNQVILIQGAYNESVKNGNLNLITYETESVSFTSTAKTLLWLIGRIEIDSLSGFYKKKLQSHVHLPTFHAKTVDRVDQSDQFQMSYYYPEENSGKVRNFYMYGDAKQAHGSLFKRLGKEIAGYMCDWEAGDFKPDMKIAFESFKPAVSRNPMLYQINIVKELFARFFPRINHKQPLRNKTIKDLAESPELIDFGSNDMVFILLTMDDKNWNVNITPQVVKFLIEKFLAVDLPEDSPTFYFFFGIEYEQENQQKKEEVKMAIQNREYGGNVFDELTPVTTDDITEWFSRYRNIMVESGKQPKDMVKAFFGEEENYNMNQVEAKLLRLIENHNKGIVISTKNQL